MKVKEGEYDLQPFQRGLNVGKFEEDRPVRDIFIIKHEADAPDNRREADILDAGQVVQNNLGLGLGGHVMICSNEDSIEQMKCNHSDSDPRRPCEDANRKDVLIRFSISIDNTCALGTWLCQLTSLVRSDLPYFIN